MPDANHVESALEDTFPDRPRRVPLRHRRAGGRGVAGGDVGESEGTVMNMERRVSRVSAAREPPADVRQDVDIIGAVADRVVFGSVRFDAARPRSAVRRGQRPARGTADDLGDLLRAAVRGAGRPVARPGRDRRGRYRYYDGDGGRRRRQGRNPDDADGRWSFPTDSGRARFSNASHRACRSRSTRRTPRSPPAVVRTRTTPGSGLGLTLTTTGRDGRADAPETIADNLRAFDRGETVIESRRSAVTVGVAPDAHVPPGLVWLPVHNPAANRLTLSAADPVSRAEPQAVRGRVACPGPDHHRYHPVRDN